MKDNALLITTGILMLFSVTCIGAAFWMIM